MVFDEQYEMVLYYYHVVVVRCKDIEQEIQMIHLKLNKHFFFIQLFYNLKQNLNRLKITS